MNFHHIGIFVNKIEAGKKIMEKKIRIKSFSKVIKDRNLKVKIMFIKDKDNITYELVAPFGKGNPVDKILKSRTNILNHLGYKVKNFDKKCKYFRNIGYGFLTSPRKSVAFNNSKVVFMLSPLGFIIELVEKKF